MKTRFKFLLLAAALAGTSISCTKSDNTVELLNVSYDPTRKLWEDLNASFVPHYKQQTGVELDIKTSHGGSSSQARAVAEGLEADVVTLAMWQDTDLIRKKGRIAAGWEDRLPERSLPYYSTIVFVVRQGNPKNIQDWPDLVRPDVENITPNPLTSGNGKLSFLAAWGSVKLKGGSDEEAKQFVTTLYKQTKVLDTAARAATASFATKELGDVHLTWENEAHLEVAESGGKLQLIYPSISIRAEPHVAVVDENVKKHGTAAAAEAYLKFLFTDEAQAIIGKNGYRPINPTILAKHSQTLPQIKLFPITDIAKSWDDAQERFFAPGAIFETIRGQKD